MNHLKITVDEEFRWRRILESQNSNLHSIVLVFLPIPTCRKSDLRCNSGQRSSSQRPSTWSQSIPQQKSHGFNRSNHSLLVPNARGFYGIFPKGPVRRILRYLHPMEKPRWHSKMEKPIGPTCMFPGRFSMTKNQTSNWWFFFPWATRNSWDNGCVGLQGIVGHSKGACQNLVAVAFSGWLNFCQPDNVTATRFLRYIWVTMRSTYLRQIDHHRWRWHNTDQMPFSENIFRRWWNQVKSIGPRS